MPLRRIFYKRKEERLGTEIMGRIEKMVVLQVIDEKWKDHLREMDDLKEGIHLRAYGQKDPLVEYKTEGFRMFMELIDLIDTEIVTPSSGCSPPRRRNSTPGGRSARRRLSGRRTIRLSVWASGQPRAMCRGCGRGSGAGRETPAGACGRESRTKRSVPLRERKKYKTVSREVRRAAMKKIEAIIRPFRIDDVREASRGDRASKDDSHRSQGLRPPERAYRLYRGWIPD